MEGKIGDILITSRNTDIINEDFLPCTEFEIDDNKYPLLGDICDSNFSHFINYRKRLNNIAVAQMVINEINDSYITCYRNSSSKIVVVQTNKITKEVKEYSTEIDLSTYGSAYGVVYYPITQ